MIVVCAMKFSTKMCMQRVEVGDVSKLSLNRHTSCMKSQLSNKRPYPLRKIASVIKINQTKALSV